MLELETVVARITSVFPKKDGKKDDSPLAIIIKFDLDLQANEVLPQFHPSLNGFIYDDHGVRFAGLGSFSWHENHSNMQIEIQDLVLPASKLGKYWITPYTTLTTDDPEIRNRLWLSCEAKIDIGNVAPSPLNILSEMINTNVEMTIRPSQLLIPEMRWLKIKIRRWMYPLAFKQRHLSKS